jgi:GH43 family beta-xylosidase
LLSNEGDDFMDAATWRKAGPVFRKNEHAWGVGHCGFADTRDGQSWLMYHAKTSRRPGWNDREVRAQPFTWAADGTPIFEQPLPILRERGAVTMSARLRRPVRRMFSLAGAPA